MSNNNTQSEHFRRLKIFWRRNYAAILLLALLGLLLGACVIETNSLKTTEIEFTASQVTAELDGLRIAFISDLHASHNNLPLLEKAIAQVNQSNVDLVLLGGDFINATRATLPPEQLITLLEQLHAPLGVYAVPGNHEHRRDIETFEELFINSTVKLLLDEAVEIKTPRNGVINLAGLDYMVNPQKRNDPDKYRKLLSAKHLNIVLTHTPEDFQYLPENAHLTLAGHTHGGQVNIPFLGSVIKPAFGRELNYGKKISGSKVMFVSCGISSAYTKARLGMRPEIVIITLRSSDKN